MTVSLFRGSRTHARGLLGLDAGNRAPHVLDPRSLFQLAGRGLEAQVECLALQFAELLGELVVGLLAHVFGLGHGPQPSRCEVSPRRATTFVLRSEEHTSELQLLMRISYAVFCLKKKKK